MGGAVGTPASQGYRKAICIGVRVERRQMASVLATQHLSFLMRAMTMLLPSLLVLARLLMRDLETTQH
jgi:hypothetical protein